ncbi:MAG: transposase, partial [Bifidobacteriaceae bacterium]|nr:transposase [Bifidobacteriaceae bacterium]
MSYRYYSEDERRKVVDDYFSSGMKHSKYARTISVHTRTLRRWIEADDRSCIRHRLRINCKE